MPLRRLLVFALFGLAAALRAQTPPVEYETFVSQGKAVSCAVYGAHEATATIIFLRGASPSDLSLGRLEARFFAEHGFRVLLPDYFSATPTAEATTAIRLSATRRLVSPDRPRELLSPSLPAPKS
jgi:hypothetical protein